MWFHSLLSRIPSWLGPAPWPTPELEDILALLILVGFALLLTAERCLSRSLHRAKIVRQSYRTNLYTFLFNDGVMSLLSVSTLLTVAEHYSGWGLLSGLEQPVLKAGICFVLLDLVMYLWHRANHTFDGLWFLHRVHHSDRNVNVSTAFRLHVGEVLLTTVIKAAFIVAVGVDVLTVGICEAVITLFVMFHHANISFRAEGWLKRLFVVPALHRLHHSTRRSEHDRNYGFVFSFWDRLFGTLDERKPAAIGLPYVPSMSFPELLKYGFRPDAATNSAAVTAMIAKAAYFKAEKRGFLPGWELHDWLEAENEIRRLKRFF